MTQHSDQQLATLDDSRMAANHAPEARSRVKVTRYQIAIVAESVDDLVSSIGGWLFDHILAGWVVTSIRISGRKLEEHELRPLTILGYRPRLEVVRGGLPAQRNRAPRQLVAVSSAAAEHDERLRARLHRSLNNKGAEIVLWGRDVTPLLGEGLSLTGFRLSTAARVFKAEALRASSLPVEDPADTEYMYRNVTQMPAAQARAVALNRQAGAHNHGLPQARAGGFGMSGTEATDRESILRR